MKNDRGAVLINALVVVLAIAAIAAALLTRSEAARVRIGSAQVAEQLDHYLDAAERFVPSLIGQVVTDSITEPGQVWATPRVYDIDRGQVAVTMTDLQGRLNVNWLLREDEFVDETFRTVFSQLSVPQSLIFEIRDFISPSGPRGTGYLNRKPPVWPRGGAMKTLEDLRAVEGISPEIFATLKPYLTARPSDQRINLNTAPDIVKRAIVAKLPSELIADVMTRSAPIESIGYLRLLAAEILQTEDFEGLQLERMTTSSTWFRAELTASLDGRTAKRTAVFLVTQDPQNPVQRVYRWAVYD